MLGLAAAPAWAAEPTTAPASQPAFRKPYREPRIVQKGFLWLDAEDFKDYGGWRLDTQFVYLMGSGYLMAAGVGTPVADAITPIVLPASAAGTYRVWVRTRDWRPQERHSPGQFELLVNSRALPVRFGAAATDDWLWQSGGEVDLPAGASTLALRDRTGYFARCDAIILTTDLTYTPPADREAVIRERARLTGLSLDAKPGGTYDVVVVGAGPAGCPAALAAARLGARTVLIHDRPVVGGNASCEAGVPMEGADIVHPNARASGIVEEALRLSCHGRLPFAGDAFAVLIDRQPNLTLRCNQRVFDAQSDAAGRITAVRAVDTLTGEVHDYRGAMFIDTTGDGWVGYYAKAEHRLGREARSEYGESLAPEKADAVTMSGCLMGRPDGRFALGFSAEDTGKPAPYSAPPWAIRMPMPFGRAAPPPNTGSWWLEYPGVTDDIGQAERARDELIRISFGYWDYVKNRSERKAEAARWAMTYVPILNAKRETRRLIGDYVLTQNDVLSARIFPDRISFGGWPIDLHHPEGVLSGSAGPFDSNRFVAQPYSIPYRCLYSKNVANLLFAGRCASVSHVALGTVRVESTLATLGQAAGTAAALCASNCVSPRELGSKHLTLLQQTLLKNDQTIADLANDDPADLARTATVTASSTAQGIELTEPAINRGVQRALADERGVVLPVVAGQSIDSIALHLKSTRPEESAVTLHVASVGSFDNPAPIGPVADATAKVSPKTEAWVSFEVKAKLAGPFAAIWLSRAPGLAWTDMSVAPPRSARFSRTQPDRPWSIERHRLTAFKTVPPLRLAGDYAPANVIDGRTRMSADAANLWASDPDKPLPAWVELDFGRPVAVNSVRLTFDTDMSTRGRTGRGHTDPPECVRDYDLAALRDGKWRVLFEEKDNFQRFRIHRFDEVATQRLRLTIRATHGNTSARLFEWRAYRDER